MRVLVVPLFLALAVLAGCAEGTGGPPGDATGDGGTGDAAGDGTRLTDDTLQITVDPGEGAPEQQYTLTCSGGIEGTVPDPARACEYLDSLQEPFAPVPDDAICTEQYGGPQTARIIGSWDGEPVDLELSRVNGCKIAQWDRLAPLLPVSV